MAHMPLMSLSLSLIFSFPIFSICFKMFLHCRFHIILSSSFFLLLLLFQLLLLLQLLLVPRSMHFSHPRFPSLQRFNAPVDARSSVTRHFLVFVIVGAREWLNACVKEDVPSKRLDFGTNERAQSQNIPQMAKFVGAIVRLRGCIYRKMYMCTGIWVRILSGIDSSDFRIKCISECISQSLLEEMSM